MALVISAVIFLPPQTAMTIQSLESKNIHGDPVYNQIKFFPGFTKDVWMMNQSHHGLHVNSDKWDRLAIIVDKSGAKKTAQFLQLPPGELNWSEDLPTKAIPYRVSCFICHSNGPRAIRPDFEALSLDWSAKLKVIAWNLRIKTYRRIIENPKQLDIYKIAKVPFRHPSKIDNEKLEVASCTKCHQESGIINRGYLTRQNSIAIYFMTKNNLMPPPGFSITNEDKVKIQNFLLGL
jgi:hypothetical protein